MSDQPCQTPLLELARSVPKDLRGEWETQWFEDGTPCGHAMAPIGKYLHDMADEIERLRAALESIANNTCCDPCQEAKLVAKAALEQDHE